MSTLDYYALCFLKIFNYVHVDIVKNISKKNDHNFFPHFYRVSSNKIFMTWPLLKLLKLLFVRIFMYLTNVFRGPSNSCGSVRESTKKAENRLWNANVPDQFRFIFPYLLFTVLCPTNALLWNKPISIIKLLTMQNLIEMLV